MIICTAGMIYGILFLIFLVKLLRISFLEPSFKKFKLNILISIVFSIFWPFACLIAFLYFNGYKIYKYLSRKNVSKPDTIK